MSEREVHNKLFGVSLKFERVKTALAKKLLNELEILYESQSKSCKFKLVTVSLIFVTAGKRKLDIQNIQMEEDQIIELPPLPDED